ncbi:dipeptidase [Alicyclobacillus macrosporangiidus]|uniref:dipeptidase n=1 Tax=Alicyclobacillus macrosporangiidus TaxID=392015 RepID=UPI000B0EF830|nr:membrane dipeptidase [Alicyclobacillus macrosporangiidus]
MKKKNYKGYKSFQYLEPGVDYKPFKLAKEIDRVPRYTVPLSDAEEARVKRLFEENVVISLHDHMFVVPENVNEIFEYRRWGRDWTGYEGLSVSGLDAVFDNLMNGTAMITSRNGWKWDDIIYDLGMRLSDIAHQDMVILGQTVDDIIRAKENGQIAFIPSLEAATMIENELDRLDILYGLGVRCIGIAYSEGNQLGCGLKERRDGGLTDFGRKAVRRMNKLGLAIDVSHSGDQTALDTIETSEKPVFITHAGARALWNSNRLKPDHVIKACAERGGVIGIEAAPHTTLTKNHPKHCLESVMEHFEYCVDLVGIDHVAFGPDVLFGDHVGLHHAFAEALSISASRGKNEFEEVEYVEGIESPVEAFPNIVRWLVKHGYSDTEISKVIGGNILRVLKEVWYR